MTEVACTKCGKALPLEAMVCLKCAAPVPAIALMQAPRTLGEVGIPAEAAVLDALRARLKGGFFYRQDFRARIKTFPMERALAVVTRITFLTDNMHVEVQAGRGGDYSGKVTGFDDIEPPRGMAEEDTFYRWSAAGLSESAGCPGCGGTGRVRCRPTVVCHHSNLRDRLDCYSCGGSGRRDCGDCGGTGERPCGCEGGRIHFHYRLHVTRRRNVFETVLPDAKHPDLISEVEASGATGIPIFAAAGNPDEFPPAMAEVLPVVADIGVEQGFREHMGKVFAGPRDFMSKVVADLGGQRFNMVDFFAKGKSVTIPRSARIDVGVVPAWRIPYVLRGDESRREQFTVLGKDLRVLQGMPRRLLDPWRIGIVALLSILVLLALPLASVYFSMGRDSSATPTGVVAPTPPPSKTRRAGNTTVPRLPGLSTIRRDDRSPATSSKSIVKQEMESSLHALIVKKADAADAGDVVHLGELEKEYGSLVDHYIAEFGRPAWDKFKAKEAVDQSVRQPKQAPGPSPAHLEAESQRRGSPVEQAPRKRSVFRRIGGYLLESVTPE